MGLKGSWSYLHLRLMGEIVGCAGLLVSYRTAAHSGSHCIDRPWPCRATRPQPSWGVHGLSTIQGTRLLPHPQKASRSLGPSIVAASLWLSFHLPHLCNPFTRLHPLPELSFFSSLVPTWSSFLLNENPFWASFWTWPFSVSIQMTHPPYSPH